MPIQHVCDIFNLHGIFKSTINLIPNFILYYCNQVLRPVHSALGDPGFISRSQWHQTIKTRNGILFSVCSYLIKFKFFMIVKCIDHIIIMCICGAI